MSEADNPTTPRKRSSHRPAGFGPLSSRNTPPLAREESPADEADVPQSLDEAVLEARLETPSVASLPTRLPEVKAGETGAETAVVEETTLPPADASATVAWVSRLTAEFEAATASDDLEGQMQYLQEQNRRLQAQNRELLEQKAILEVTLEETQAALQLQMTRSQNQEALLVQQAQALAESQAQTSSLYRDLELAQQTAQRQQIMIETLTEQLESSQERVAQLEQEVATAQAHVNEKVHALMQAEAACRDLRTRLNRQQRYALQFKTALERCLDMPALRRSMVTATGKETVANSTANHPANQAGAPDLSQRPEAAPEKAAAAPSPAAASNPAMTPADLVEVSSHLQSLLDEAAASASLEAAASLSIPRRDFQADLDDAPGGGFGLALPGETTLTSEAGLLAIPPRARESVDSLPAPEPVSDQPLALADDPNDGAAGEAIAQASTVILPDSQVASTPAAQADRQPEAEPEAIIAEAIPEDGDEAAASLRSEVSPPEQEGMAAPSLSPVRFPADRLQADLWQRFNQWAAASGVEEPPASDAPPVDEHVPTPAAVDEAAATIVPPQLAQRGIQPLRPSPQVPRFVSQWSEATGRTTAERPAASTEADGAKVQVSTAATPFTGARRRPAGIPGPEVPIAQTRPVSEPATSPPATTRKRIELPRPQAEAETAAQAATGPAIPPAETREDEFPALSNWPSPLVYPLRPSKKRKSLAAIDLPNFARPHS